MSKGVQTIIYPVKDINATKQLFNALLGVEPVMDQPYYVGYRVGGQDIGLDPHGHAKGMTGPLAYVQVADIEATLAALLAAGASEVQGVKDVGGGKLIASVQDADGNPIGLMQEP